MKEHFSLFYRQCFLNGIMEQASEELSETLVLNFEETVIPFSRRTILIRSWSVNILHARRAMVSCRLQTNITFFDAFHQK